MASASVVEYSARNERWIVLAALALVSAMGLVATLRIGDSLMASSIMGEASSAYPFLLFLMWWTMMMAMMLPSAAPAILTFAAVSRRISAQATALPPVMVFASGYAAVWTGFSVIAVALHALLAGTIKLNMMMAVTSSLVGGALLIAAGIYQLSPLKSACLTKCQAPLMFLARSWRKGHLGAFRMGFEHGVYCLGCCWVLMGLLFYGGVMEWRWIFGLSVYVAIEKFVPAGSRLSTMTGWFLVGWGLWTVWQAVNMAV